MSYLDHDPRILPPERFFFLTDLAAGLFVLWGLSLVTGWLESARSLLWLAWTLLLFVQFFRRGQDEFWDHCWQRASSVTFLALVVVPFTWAFGEGLVDGFTGEPPFRTKEPSFDGVVAILFLVFFGSFEWTRFRESRG